METITRVCTFNCKAKARLKLSINDQWEIIDILDVIDVEDIENIEDINIIF